MSWRDIKPGGQLSARRLNDAAARAEERLVLNTGGGIRRGAGGTVIDPYERVEFFAQVLSTDGLGNYAWQEMYFDVLNGWTLVAGGRTGSTTLLPAIEINGRPILNGALVHVWLDPSQQFYLTEMDSAAAELSGCYPYVVAASCGSGGLSVTSSTFWYTIYGLFTCDCCDGYSFYASACSVCGSGSGTGSGSGNTGCCPGVTLPSTLHVTIAFCNITFAITKSGNTWSGHNQLYNSCLGGTVNIALTCSGSSFSLTYNGVGCITGSIDCATPSFTFTCAGHTVTITS